MIALTARLIFLTRGATRRYTFCIPIPNVSTLPLTGFNNLGVAPNVGKFAYNAWYMKFNYEWNPKNRSFFSETQNYGSNNSSTNRLPTGNPAKLGSDPARRNLYGASESFNVTNSPIYAAPNATVTSPLFGSITISQQNFPRNMQFALRVRF